MKNILVVILAALVFASCEKTIDLDYKNNQSRLAIEGAITDKEGPYYVKISETIALANMGSYPTIDNAIVTISDNADHSERLVHEGNGVYKTSTLRGVVGRTYTLTVNVGAQMYTAVSTMPQKVPFESIKVESVSVLGEIEHNLIPLYRDPIVRGNYYRFLVTINGKFVNQHLVQNDEVKNGMENTMRLEINEDDYKLVSGDQVSILMQCVDQSVGKYYTTLMLMVDSGPGGSVTPSNPPNNISNGALGIFSAYTEEERNVIVP